MATTIRTTKTGRVIVEKNGCDEKWGGASVQGGIVCKVSLPKSVTVHMSAEGEQYLQLDGVSMWVNDIVKLANAGEIKGAKVYEFRVIR